MRVLLTGASGFIGRALAQALEARGHELVRVSRHADEAAGDLRADFSQVPPRHWWLPRLGQVDAVVNAVGILREQGGQRFEPLHTRAPIELFEACTAAGVPCVLQVSALGADEGAASRYHRSKRAADEHLRTLPLRSATIVQPSLVYGAGGASAALFNRMACAPLLPLPGGGRMAVQPVHLQDVVEGLVALVETAPSPTPVRTLVFAGPQPMSLARYLRELRAALGIDSPLRVLPVPEALFRAAAALAGRLPGSMLDRETADMLLRGNAAPADELARLLGRSPRPVREFVSDDQAAPLRRQAALDTWVPVLRVSVALMWIWTGIVSLGLYPVERSYELLARVGLHGPAAAVALYGAALLDLLLGVLTLASPAGWRRWVWASQLLLIAGYTGLITLFLPEFWLHPYGPILKNLPVMAAIALLWSLEAPRPTRRAP